MVTAVVIVVLLEIMSLVVIVVVSSVFGSVSSSVSDYSGCSRSDFLLSVYDVEGTVLRGLCEFSC